MDTLLATARIDKVTAADFPVIASLAEEIWHGHYTGIISEAQIDYMLAGRYTPEYLHPYLAARDRWLELLRLSGEAVGYFSYALTATKAEMKVEQLYLLSRFRGMGLGSLMMSHIQEQALANNTRSLILQVNRRNYGAIKFYRKAGFIVRENVVLDIGKGFVMDDHVMVKSL